MTKQIPQINNKQLQVEAQKLFAKNVLLPDNNLIVKDFISELAKDYIDQGFEANPNIELFSPMIAERIVFKIRVSNASERAIKADLSMFFVEGEQIKEQYIADIKVRSRDLAKLFHTAWESAKTVIPYCKFSKGIQGVDYVKCDETVYNAVRLLNKYFDQNEPVAY